ncbi:hypothetical protein [Halobacterium jilantaiense]|uniref:hypothetical protein n=1 Tax=Halobacterium jilantaiense TaxID=355548 RepID=UPI00115FC62F|nr:hypothetical protein [Halobacterium jilantaiense]
MFERDGEIEYWRTFDVPADDPEDDSGGSTNLPVEAIENTAAIWTVRAFNHHTEQHTTAVLEDETEDEVRVRVHLPRDGEIQIWKGLI